ncbi:unnamed protein product [Brachionus calyciflorus]|uniref:Thioredoxin domain-containing protein n=1 Tax=Brachionus calyciflorus TaxID=104777 RepID=A0A813MA55_9BILA|nr:unnamed protein product [Brachionus calyciflorus]
MRLMNFIFYTLTLMICWLGKIKCDEQEEEPLVYEMDDRVIDFTTQGKWIIMFYAPWCGHCKKLEPVFEELGKYYKGKMMTVAKVDATRFLKAANHFNIKGYPTIKFIYGKTNLNYYGERRKGDLIEFIKKADAPRVSRVLHQLDFENTKHEIGQFFVLIIKKDQFNSSVKEEFFSLAEKHFLDAYFYYALPEYVVKTARVTDSPRVGVIKDNELELWDSSKQTMEEFIKFEQFETYCEVTMTNFHNLIETKKIVLILLINLDDLSKLHQTRKIRQLFRVYAKTSKEKYHDDFIFGYSENHDLINGIAIWSLSTPCLFIFNTTSYTYSIVYFLDRDNKVMDFSIDQILDDIKNNKLEIYGGRSILRSIRRPLWEIYRAILEMFIEAPIISLFIFGIPFGVISIVFYFLCCMDTTDQTEGEELHDSDVEDDHQYYLDEASKLHEQIKSKETQEILKIEGNKIKIPTGSKKNQ